MNNQNSTLNNTTSATDFRNALNINLSNIQEVADSIKTALNNGQLNSIGDMSSLVSPDKLMSMVAEQSNLISCTLASLGSTSVLGQNGMQSTLNTALSTVLGTMTCSMANMKDSISRINELSRQVESIKTSMTAGNIDELKKVVKS